MLGKNVKQLAGSRLFIRTASCFTFPLALEVLGSSLFGKSINEWKNALEMLKEHSEPAITRVLKVSYDGLQESMQEIFKDIACFFNHEDRDHVVKILNELGRYPLIGSSNLIDKSLLTISENNVLWMHDLVRDMCRNIVYQESPNEPRKRSRLWDHKDINHVLKKNTVRIYLLELILYLLIHQQS